MPLDLTKPFPAKQTIGERYMPAMELTEQSEADAYFERLVESAMRDFGSTREEAESLERQNLGYFAGYYTSGTRARVERLFRCAHPVFGAIAEKGSPTPDEAFSAGLRLGAGD